MATPQKSSIGSLKRSWGDTSRRSKSPGKSPPKKTEEPATIVSEVPASPSITQRSTSPGRAHQSPRLRASSPRRQTVNLSQDAKDPTTDCIDTIPNVDARVTLNVNGLIWIGERDGSITIRKHDGEVVHVIERRKGAYVWSLVEVGASVWAGCSDGFIRVLNSATYKMERQFARHAGGGGGVNALTFHAPSNTVFSGSNDFEILAWDASTGTFERQFPAAAGVKTLLADTHVLYSGSDDGAVTVWDILSGEKKATWTGHTKGVQSLAQTEFHVWSGSEDATIRIWNPQTGDCVGVAEVHTGGVATLTPIGNKVWSAAGDTLCLWDAEKLKLLGTYVAHEGYVGAIQIVSRTAHFKVWTAATDRVLKVWETAVIPDETDSLKRKIEKLSSAEYENRILKEQLSQRDRRIAELEATVGDLQQELDRRKNVDAENQRLREIIQEHEDTIARLRSRLAQSEEDNRELRRHIENLDRQLADLRAENGQLAADLAASRAEGERLAEKLRDTIQSYETKLKDTTAAYEARLRDAHNRIADLEAQNEQFRREIESLTADNQRLQEELKKAHEQIDLMAAKLKEMDVIFKSRLSLITEVFQVYKKIDGADKKLKGINIASQELRDFRDQLSGSVAEFKTVITNHYTDDELHHLGSSRHLFPTSPRAGAR
eukprot:TRINITY_DN1901_c0_g1_i2.p1 TRINITY_DN1901_c0_g1~~TRINITY_DN1901_c0_g1_i2.p1  ORF type:complete len:660 (+),score=153.14 TRINITY_DN1901_c0_g1_i2:49-2028(+)